MDHFLPVYGHQTAGDCCTSHGSLKEQTAPLCHIWLLFHFTFYLAIYSRAMLLPSQIQTVLLAWMLMAMFLLLQHSCADSALADIPVPCLTPYSWPWWLSSWSIARSQIFDCMPPPHLMHSWACQDPSMVIWLLLASNMLAKPPHCLKHYNLFPSPYDSL